MKRKIGLGLLILSTVVVLGWTAAVVEFKNTYVGMMSLCAPGSKEYNQGVAETSAAWKEIFAWTVMPLVVLNLLWIVAFALKRQGSGHLDRGIGQKKE